MSVANIKSGWSSGNLVFEAAYSGLATTPVIQFGKTDLPIQSKFHNRPATSGSTVEVRARPSSATAEHFAIDSTLDWRPTGASVTGGGVRAVQGVARLDAEKTMTGGSITGVYGQVANNGTINGAGVMLSALYGLIEDGGTYTALSHLASCWLDSHLDQAVSAGEIEFLYMSNNGETTFDQAIYIYAGNKITNLMKISTAAGMVGDNIVGDVTFANVRPVKCDIDGTTHYLLAAQTIQAAG
jgi:hypothetical protein